MLPLGNMVRYKFLVCEANISRDFTYRFPQENIANPARDLYRKTKNLLPFRVTDFIVLSEISH